MVSREIWIWKTHLYMFYIQIALENILLSILIPKYVRTNFSYINATNIALFLPAFLKPPFCYQVIYCGLKHLKLQITYKYIER
jgi:hypothetical protein